MVAIGCKWSIGSWGRVELESVIAQGFIFKRRWTMSCVWRPGWPAVAPSLCGPTIISQDRQTGLLGGLLNSDFEGRKRGWITGRIRRCVPHLYSNILPWVYMGSSKRLTVYSLHKNDLFSLSSRLAFFVPGWVESNTCTIEDGLHRPIAAEIDRDANGFGCPRRTRAANNFPEEYRSRARRDAPHDATPHPTGPAPRHARLPRPHTSTTRYTSSSPPPPELPRLLRPRTLPIYITHTPTSRSHQNPKRRDTMVSNKQPAPQPGAIAASLAKRRQDAGMAELSVQVPEGGNGASGGSEGEIGETSHLSPIFTSLPPVDTQ
ncbi:hypothetical protein ACQJBY_020234 [Aegilops geniculata]